MLRNIVGIILGLIITASFLTIILYIGWSFYPLPEKVEFLDPKTYKFSDKTLYTGSYIFEMISYIISTFLGGVTVASIVRVAKPAYSTLIGVIVFLLLLIKLVMIPYPFWFYIISILLILPMGYFSGKWIEKIITQ